MKPDPAADAVRRTAEDGEWSWAAEEFDHSDAAQDARSRRERREEFWVRVAAVSAVVFLVVFVWAVLG